jgi:hypothetical protein
LGDKLRKIADRLWYNKERIVLAIMLLVFAWNMYRVLYPPPAKPLAKEHKLPKVTDDGTLPSQPVPRGPDVRAMTSWKTVYTPSPFWYYAVQSGKSGDEGKDKDAGIHLRQIKEMGGGVFRAQLETTARKWYSEGDKFEQFELQKIDPDAQTVRVYSERLGQVITLSVE